MISVSGCKWKGKYDEISRINYLEDLIRIDIKKTIDEETSEDEDD